MLELYISRRVTANKNTTVDLSTFNRVLFSYPNCLHRHINVRCPMNGARQHRIYKSICRLNSDRKEKYENT